MNIMIRRATSAGIVLLLAAPAAAQEPSRDFERQIDRHIERLIEAHAREFARLIEAGARELERAIEQGPQRAGRPPRPPRPGERGRDGGPEVTERFSRTIRLDRNGTFDLSNVSGDIIVTGGGGNDVQIDAVKRVRGRSDADAKALLQETQIVVRETGNRIEVRTELPREERNVRGAAVDYTVAVPQDANVILRTVAGDMRITNVRGELRAESISGDVQASGAQRLGALKTVSGDIQVTDAQGDVVNLTSISGDTTVRGMKARGVELTSVSGDLMLTDVECERATVRTVNGNITYTGALARSGRYELNTHSGDISLMVSATGFTVEASTFNGDVRSDYALTLGGNQLTSGRRGPPQNRTIRGAFGDGGASLSLRSFNGNISIARR